MWVWLLLVWVGCWFGLVVGLGWLLVWVGCWLLFFIFMIFLFLSCQLFCSLVGTVVYLISFEGNVILFENIT